MLEVGEVIKYRCEIGNLGEMTSTITGIVMEDENVLKLDDHGFIRYWWMGCYWTIQHQGIGGKLESFI
jgi:hypothetical protein